MEKKRLISSQQNPTLWKNVKEDVEPIYEPILSYNVK